MTIRERYWDREARDEWYRGELDEMNEDIDTLMEAVDLFKKYYFRANHREKCPCDWCKRDIKVTNLLELIG